MIKMISGTYGMPVVHPDGTTTIKGVGPAYGPFSLAPEKEQRLVDRKVAVYVQAENGEYVDAPAAPVEGVENAAADVPVGFDEIPPDELPEGVIGIPEYSMENTKKELQAIGEMCGLELDSRMTKPEMIAALDAYIAENTVEDDGEDAPAFDATEAVL